MSHTHILTIDGCKVEVPAGATVLEAARQLGIAIPTLCHRHGLAPGTSCMVCVVEIEGIHRLVPACAYPASAGLAIQTDTPAVRNARRTTVELLMTEHVGDCEGPCRRACPANMEIPLMIRHLAAGNTAAALETVQRDIALPSILGRICPAPCEKVCRRGKVDRPVSICLLKRFAGDYGLKAGHNPLTGGGAMPDTGRRVAIVGSGPAGLAAAFHLRKHGHACDIFDERPAAGGTLRIGGPQDRLPPDVLDREIAVILSGGVTFHAGVGVGRNIALSDLRSRYDAVILATGVTDATRAAALGVPATPRGIQANRGTYQTPLPGVFAIGSALRPLKMAVRAVADGKECAFACNQLLMGQPVMGEPKRFNCVIGKLEESELQAMLIQGSDRQGIVPGSELTGESVADEATRCLHCDCRKAGDCRLREAVEPLGADIRQHAESGRNAVEILNHPDGLVFESGKCIKCGLCVRLAGQHADIPGLTFIRRGFQTRVSPPAGETWETALGRFTGEIAAACPTGALTVVPIHPPTSPQTHPR